MFQRVSLQPTAEQRQLIAEELGKEPRGMQQITALDGRGRPLAVQVAALVDGKPFPTCYWLTSRLLVKALSRLEAAGLIKTLETRLQQDPVLMQAYQRSHEDYVARRWAAMDAAMQQEVDRLGYRPVFSMRGVGGIENWSQIRCLHTQYAHHLSSARGNAIGHLLDAEHGMAACLP